MALKKQEMMNIEKVTVNIGTGESGEKLNKAITLLERITQQKPIKTRGRKKVPVWDVREGKAIGTKVTLRGKEAKDFLEKALQAVENGLNEKNFDKTGNVSFGVEEYIEIPGIKYDPKIGMYGFDVAVTMNKWGYRVKKRKIQPKKIPTKHQVTKQDTMQYFKDNFNVEIKERGK